MGVRVEAGTAASPPFRENLISAVRPLLGVSLMSKLIGANALIVMVAATVIRVTAPPESPGQLTVVTAAFVAAVAVNLLLVWLALRPVYDLERVATQLWRGNLTARVPASPLADVHIARTGIMLNSLLDTLAAERERLRHLTAQVIRLGDEERMRITHELHDSVAQRTAALMYLAASGARTAESDDQRQQLEAMRLTAADIVEELQMLSQSIHPRVLDDLGIEAALSWLGRTTAERTGLHVAVDASGGRGLPTATEWALYRVAQESLRNVQRHARAERVSVRLTREGRVVRLEIVDDGVGFVVADAEARRPGMGLFSVRERMSLVDGTLHVDSTEGAGTRILATVPL
jgi:signal transduction histidine kinase